MTRTDRRRTRSWSFLWVKSMHCGVQHVIYVEQHNKSSAKGRCYKCNFGQLILAILRYFVLLSAYKQKIV